MTVIMYHLILKKRERNYYNLLQCYNFVIEKNFLSHNFKHFITRNCSLSRMTIINIYFSSSSYHQLNWILNFLNKFLTETVSHIILSHSLDDVIDVTIFLQEYRTIILLHVKILCVYGIDERVCVLNGY